VDTRGRPARPLGLSAAGYLIDMEALAWILTLVLVFSGNVLAIRHRMFWGIGLIVTGMITGLGATSLAN